MSEAILDEVSQSLADITPWIRSAKAADRYITNLATGHDIDQILKDRRVCMLDFYQNQRGRPYLTDDGFHFSLNPLCSDGSFESARMLGMLIGQTFAFNITKKRPELMISHEFWQEIMPYFAFLFSGRFLEKLGSEHVMHWLRDYSARHC